MPSVDGVCAHCQCFHYEQSVPAQSLSCIISILSPAGTKWSAKLLESRTIGVCDKSDCDTVYQHNLALNRQVQLVAFNA